MAAGKSAGISPKQNYSGGTTPIQDDKIPTEKSALNIRAQPPKAKCTGKQLTHHERESPGKEAGLDSGAISIQLGKQKHLEYLKETGHLTQGAGFSDDGRGKS